MKINSMRWLQSKNCQLSHCLIRQSTFSSPLLRRITVTNNNNNNNNEKLVLRHKMQMQTQQRTPLSNHRTRNQTSVSSAYSWNSTKRLSYHVNLWEGSSMQPGLSTWSCGSRMVEVVHHLERTVFFVISYFNLSLHGSTLYNLPITQWCHGPHPTPPPFWPDVFDEWPHN